MQTEVGVQVDEERLRELRDSAAEQAGIQGVYVHAIAEDGTALLQGVVDLGNGEEPVRALWDMNLGRVEWQPRDPELETGWPERFLTAEEIERLETPTLSLSA